MSDPYSSLFKKLDNNLLMHFAYDDFPDKSALAVYRRFFHFRSNHFLVDHQRQKNHLWANYHQNIHDLRRQ